MIQESIYTRYQPQVNPKGPMGEDTLWFLFMQERLLVYGLADCPQLPTAADLRRFHLTPEQPLYLGTLDGRPCFTGGITADTALPETARFEELRTLFGCMEDGLFLLAGRALQIVHWHRMNRFCGRCGTLSEDKADERAKCCPNCGAVVYPTVSPAIIVAVERDDTLLLAHAAHFKDNMYSVIAGYTEPGETLEECVRRELSEEVGIAVKNIRYFGSQPWPYSGSLMVAFTAEYASGEIEVDHKEIEAAGWYTANQLPNIPNPISISRSLIDWFIKKHTGQGH